MSCKGRDPEGQAPSSYIGRTGDTIHVFAAGHGMWGAPHAAVRDTALLGPAAGHPFGAIEAFATTPDGGVVVFDSNGPDGLTLERFAPNGTYVGSIGRRGTGPGEYNTSNVSVAVASDGTIFLFDRLMNRVTRYDSAGRVLGMTRIRSGVGGTPEMIPAADGAVYLRGAFDRTLMATGQTVLDQPMLLIGATGAVIDSVHAPDAWRLARQGNRGASWSVDRDGTILLTRTDSVGFLAIARGRAPIHAYLRAAAVAYLPEERAEAQRILEWDRPRSESKPPQIPEFKPLAVSAETDLDGRIWIRLTSRAVRIPPQVKFWGRNGSISTSWADPPRYAAFDRSGSFLGEVSFPVRAKVSFVGNYAWAVIPDADDQQWLVRFSLTVPK